MTPRNEVMTWPNYMSLVHAVMNDVEGFEKAGKERKKQIVSHLSGMCTMALFVTGMYSLGVRIQEIIIGLQTGDDDKVSKLVDELKRNAEVWLTEINYTK